MQSMQCSRGAVPCLGGLKPASHTLVPHSNPALLAPACAPGPCAQPHRPAVLGADLNLIPRDHYVGPLQAGAGRVLRQPACKGCQCWAPAGRAAPLFAVRPRSRETTKQLASQLARKPAYLRGGRLAEQLCHQLLHRAGVAGAAAAPGPQGRHVITGGRAVHAARGARQLRVHGACRHPAPAVPAAPAADQQRAQRQAAEGRGAANGDACGVRGVCEAQQSWAGQRWGAGTAALETQGAAAAWQLRT